MAAMPPAQKADRNGGTVESFLLTIAPVWLFVFCICYLFCKNGSVFSFNLQGNERSPVPEPKAEFASK